MTLRVPRALPALLAGLLACTGTDGEPDPDAPAPVPAAVRPPGPAFSMPFDGEPIATRTLDGGLVVDDFVVGDGEEARVGGEVALHYTGYLEDGTVFDSSLKRRRPFAFTLGEGRVIEGWDRGVPGMRVGGKRRLEVPAALGYGDKKAGKIPPGADLVFTLELVSALPPLPPPRGDDAFGGTPVATRELEGGLRVEDYAVGDGAEAGAGDVIVVHYTGRLDDATVFDSSVPRKKPITFPLGAGRVIRGWDQGLLGMRVGGLRKLVIPAALGYGDKAAGKIPPGSRLTFTVELMAIRPRPARG
jgi:peptidylprolyl isomerase